MQRRPRGSGRIDPPASPGGSWAIRFTEKGRCRRVGRLPSREVAARLLAKVTGELAQGLPANPTFREVAVAPVHRDGDAPGELPAPLDQVAHLLHEACFGMERATGVYFLLKAGAVVYVGQARNVRRRLGQHMAEVDFDRAVWMEIKPDLLDVAERCLIALLRPPLNRDTFELTEQRARWLADLGFRAAARAAGPVSRDSGTERRPATARDGARLFGTLAGRVPTFGDSRRLQATTVAEF